MNCMELNFRREKIKKKEFLKINYLTVGSVPKSSRISSSYCSISFIWKLLDNKPIMDYVEMKREQAFLSFCLNICSSNYV